MTDNAVHQLIDGDRLEARLEEVLAAAPSPEAGIFGPDSVVWRITRVTPVYLLATPVSGFMHAAHPWIAHGVKQHSSLFEDPRHRAQLTYLMLMRLVFGDVPTVRRTARGLFRMHERVVGEVPERAGRFAAGSPYVANEVDALLWVHLVFFWSRLHLYRAVVGEVSPADRERYVTESNRFAACFGIPQASLPRTYGDLERLVETIGRRDLARSRAGDDTVAYLFSLIPAPGRPVFRALLVETLDPHMRAALGLPEPSRGSRAWHRLLVTQLRVLRRLAPRSLTSLPAWHEAQERLGGPRQPALSRRFGSLVVGRPRTLA